MWYVIQTSTGREEKIKQECEQRISKDVLSHCVLPLYEEKIKYKGQWHIQKKKLFPGYLFLISENLDELHEQLKRVEAMTKLLGAGDDIIALTQNEIDFLLRFAGDEELVKMSQGMIIGDKVVILSGPLKGMESTIQRIDRHKRKAWLNLEMFGRQQLVEVGVEIVKLHVKRKIEERHRVWNCWLYWTSSGRSYSFGRSVKTGVSRLRFSRTCCSQRRKKN
ncbi:MAG: antiterminator LoaP [Lachnospiraceae bacterium]